MKPFRLAHPTPSEHDLQAAILRYLAWDPRVAWVHRFNTGAHVVIGHNKAGKPTRRFIRYAFTGCADLLGQLTTGQFLAIECKRAGARWTWGGGLTRDTGPTPSGALSAPERA